MESRLGGAGMGRAKPRSREAVVMIQVNADGGLDYG